MRDTEHMRIDNDSLGFAIAHAQHHVRCLARRAGNRDQLLQSVGNLAVELLCIFFAAPWIDLALLRKKPVVRISSSSSGNEAFAIAAGVGSA